MLSFIKKIIPKPLFRLLQSPYHFCMAFLGALAYGFPSKKMIVIGVTGTKGKTTTSNLIAQILTKNGFKVGLATTVNFKIGDKEWTNESKQTMLGRWQLQALLSDMAKEKCDYAVIETSSEGILQHRHRFIDYSIAVFTNITPEHLERHGGFENYRNAKVKLFEKIADKENSVGIYNLDDQNVEYFLKPEVKAKYGYGSEFKIRPLADKLKNKFLISNIKLSGSKSEFEINGIKFEMPLIGEFNVYNAAAAICTAISQRIPIENIRLALKEAVSPPGRMEILKSKKGFWVIIDYAHEPASLEAVYKTAKNLQPADGNPQMICLLGAQGGGRDKWKRSEMGKIAADYCDKIILTNEDPYDEDPRNIVNDVALGIQEDSQSKILKIIDREEAIKKALSLASKNDLVILTGKGGEVWMCVESDKKIPWDDKQIVENILKNS